MYHRPTEPLPIGSVIDDAIRLYRFSFTRCLPLALIGALLLVALGIHESQRLGSLLTGNAGVAGAMAALARLRAMEHMPGLWLEYLATMLVWLVIRAALIIRQHTLATRDTDSVAGALASALRRLPSMVVASILWAVAVLLGTLAFILPGIWLWGRFQLWLAAMFVEDLGAPQALGRSWRLVERHWWRSTTTMGVAIVIILVLSLLGGILAGVGVAIFHASAATALILTTMMNLIINVFTAPMLTAALLAIYHDLKLRREGGDLAARVSSLQPA